MKNPFDTLFGRLALMTVGLIVLVHLTALVIVDRERGQIDAENLRTAIRLAVLAEHDTSPLAARVRDALKVSYIPAEDAIAHGCPAPGTSTHGPLEQDLLNLLPAGSQVVFKGETGDIWARYAGDTTWLKLAGSTLPGPRFLSASALMLAFAVAIALFGAWQIQRPLRMLAHAAREFRIGHRAPVVRASGPREMKELIGNFNQMVQDLAQTEQERAVMLAGVAHDLRAPITRMQVRADLLPDAGNRSGFLRDSESLSRIVTQFLDFARESADVSPRVGVDAHCSRHYGDGADDEDALVRLDLRAGQGFKLPLVDLDRILSNLIENALTYGEPPVEVSTSRRDGHYILMVRDHGSGIPAEQLERALQPFVRLDAARSGDAHCGLGLAIVRQLVRYNDGMFKAGNADEGGLIVSLTFPVAGGSER